MRLESSHRSPPELAYVTLRCGLSYVTLLFLAKTTLPNYDKLYFATTLLNYVIFYVARSISYFYMQSAVNQKKQWALLILTASANMLTGWAVAVTGWAFAH